jgi:glycosyltransferase involved in cell wall biosynthesis
MQAKTLGLSMIVKNESHVITRLLTSVVPIIDYWVIADTGSTDGTQDIITKFFEERGIPGQLLQVDWKDDFSYARNLSLNAIEEHVDYGIWIDADEELIQQNFDKQKILSGEWDSISLRTVYGKVDYTRKNIWRTKKDFQWNGPIHELLSSPLEINGTVAEGLHVIVRPEGSSWTNVREKYLSHAKILEKYTETNSDPRWVFYTAQSYRDCGENEKSIEWYLKRASIPSGFYEEIFISRFMAARLSEMIGKSKQDCTTMYQEAHTSDPVRGEAIKSLIQMYQRMGDWENAYVFSLYGTRYNRNNPYPHRILFLDKMLYDFEMLELHALSCYYTKRFEEGSVCYWAMRNQLNELGEGYLAQEMMERLISNEQYYPRPESFAKAQAPQNQRKGSNYTPPKKKRR